jgi:hypothetical protein
VKVSRQCPLVFWYRQLREGKAFGSGENREMNDWAKRVAEQTY